MASCNVFPTLTATQVSTSESFVTTSTEFVSTAPDFVSSVVFSTCAFVDPSSPCQQTVTTSFFTSPGAATTVTVPATLTIDVPVTVLATFFGSFCSSTPTPSSSSFTPFSTSTPTPTSTTPTFSPSSTDTPSSTSSLTPVVTTPPPTAYTTNSLVTSDGSVFLSSFTTTSTQAATTVLAVSTDSPSQKKIAAGPVVGGVVGGLAVLILLGLITWRLVKRQSKFNRFFGRDEGLDDYHQGPHHRGPLLEKPSYQYGMVGQSASTPPSNSRPGVQNAFGNSSGTGQAQGRPRSAVLGQAAIGNDGGQGQASGQVGGTLGNDGGLERTSGPTGALGTNGGLAGASHGVVANTHTRDPSLTTGKATSTASGATSGLLAAATSSRPSSSRPSTGGSSSHQVPGPLVTPAKAQGSYPRALHSHVYGHVPAGPSTPLNPKLSVTSVASTSSVYSNSSWVGNTSANPNDNSVGGGGGSVPPIPSSSRQQQQQHRGGNSFGRSAPRQVTNNNNADYEYSPYADMGRGSSSMGGGGGSGAGTSSSQEAPVYDERGRPLNMAPEKAPLVHLDGALYQERSGDDSRSGYEPPAYIE